MYIFSQTPGVHSVFLFPSIGMCLSQIDQSEKIQYQTPLFVCYVLRRLYVYLYVPVPCDAVQMFVVVLYDAMRL